MPESPPRKPGPAALQHRPSLERADSAARRAFTIGNWCLEPMLSLIIVVLCLAYSLACVEAAAARSAEMHALVLLAAFAASSVFLANSATAVAPTVAAIVIQHAVLVGARATAGSAALSRHAYIHTGYVSGHARSALRLWDTAALLLIMAAFAGVMCGIARGEDDRARRYFVKEFRRRREQRRWAALISNMLPPTVVSLLQKMNPKNSEGEETPPTLAWNLPHTCIFQSDIVGFTSLTQRITPHQLVSMLHALFAVGPASCCSPCHPTRFEPLFRELHGIL